MYACASRKSLKMYAYASRKYLKMYAYASRRSLKMYAYASRKSLKMYAYASRKSLKIYAYASRRSLKMYAYASRRSLKLYVYVLRPLKTVAGTPPTPPTPASVNRIPSARLRVYCTLVAAVKPGSADRRIELPIRRRGAGKILEFDFFFQNRSNFEYLEGYFEKNVPKKS